MDQSELEGSLVGSFVGQHLYEDLEDVTVRTLSGLCVERFLTHPSPQFQFIGCRTAELRRQFGNRAHRATHLEHIAVVAALRRLVDHADDILTGALSGSDCISATPGLWSRMMCEWPMGIYGRALADYINGQGLARGRILELGAGVGHASRFIRVAAGTEYIKTDLNETILRMYNRGGVLKAFDIDSSELPASDLDVVFASNVLHCAQDKIRTLSNIFRMLTPGGQLVFSEGAPEVQLDRAFCLSPLFGFFDGWWDRGGFMASSRWSESASRAGFSVASITPIECGEQILGSLITCRK